MACTCDNILAQGSVQEKHYSNCKIVWDQENPEKPTLRNDDGSIRLNNKHLKDIKVDYLYHLNFNTKDQNLPEMFGDVKFVCTGGTEYRMKEFAEYMAKRLGLPCGVNLTESSNRYAMYKVGPVLAFSHGIGIPSMTTILQEVIKMLAYAKAKDPIIIRLGTCGGLGVEAGCVVVSSFGLNGLLEKSYNAMILGEIRKYPATLDQRLAQEIESLASEKDGFKTYIGGTMASDDFYRGQARLDGPFCDYTNDDKMKFLKKVHEKGVRNIEMEATAFAAFTNEAGVRSAICCVPFLNRLHGDQVDTKKEDLKKWEVHPMIVVGRFIETYLNRKN